MFSSENVLATFKSWAFFQKTSGHPDVVLMFVNYVE
jgi:hypothetical protein